MNEDANSAPKGIPGGQVEKLADIVGYQPGAVVSRAIVKRANGSVTVFAFDRHEGLSAHTAPYDALVQIIEGQAEIVIAGAAHRLEGGEMILMPAGKPHALRAVTPFKMVLTMLRE